MADGNFFGYLLESLRSARFMSCEQVADAVNAIGCDGKPRRIVPRIEIAAITAQDVEGMEQGSVPEFAVVQRLAHVLKLDEDQRAAFYDAASTEQGHAARAVESRSGQQSAGRS